MENGTLDAAGNSVASLSQKEVETRSKRERNSEFSTKTADVSAFTVLSLGEDNSHFCKLLLSCFEILVFKKFYSHNN